ncbi:hypothetical protein Vretimale_6272 [Volvox reticuliferus]|uniref:Pherophorin domain-containing protein n=1 Tax=Volvox reticuliferus TaxID=1737510 RepID=A0A8J4CS68_9CHLO|nr:hypothetical protein Vretifemale_15984 [Volvox reticuliferus]GIM01530.1 hypothetical protein Vretimale_6272 [Volvox reticuliferus]
MALFSCPTFRIQVFYTWFFAFLLDQMVAVPLGPPSMMSGAGDTTATASCTTCLVFGFAAPPPALAYPPNNKFFYDAFGSKCNTAYSGIRQYLGTQVYDLNLTYDGFTCAPEEIKFCANISSLEVFNLLSNSTAIIVQGATGAITDMLCPAIRGAYGFTVRSETDDCMQIFPTGGLDVLCEPPPVRFPDLSCNNAPGALPVAVSPVMSMEHGKKDNTILYCFNITSAPVNKAVEGSCSAGKLTNARIWADDTKRHLVKRVRVTEAAGERPVWSKPGWSPAGGNSLKIKRSRLTLEEAIGSQICIEVDGGVDKLTDICLGGACYVSIINMKRDCCPTYAVPLP